MCDFCVEISETDFVFCATSYLYKTGYNRFGADKTKAFLENKPRLISVWSEFLFTVEVQVIENKPMMTKKISQ